MKLLENKKSEKYEENVNQMKTFENQFFYNYFIEMDRHPCPRPGCSMKSIDAHTLKIHTERPHIQWSR